MMYRNDGRTVNNSKRLTSTEMDEKRWKGICFWCDETFTIGHRCRSRQLHMVTIEVIGSEAEEELITEFKEEEEVSRESSRKFDAILFE